MIINDLKSTIANLENQISQLQNKYDSSLKEKEEMKNANKKKDNEIARLQIVYKGMEAENDKFKKMFKNTVLKLFSTAIRNSGRNTYMIIFVDMKIKHAKLSKEWGRWVFKNNDLQQKLTDVNISM